MTVVPAAGADGDRRRDHRGPLAPAVARSAIRAAVVATVVVLAAPAAAPAIPGAATTALAQQAGSPPFGFPFGGEPGPTSWLLGQLYGNTTSAWFFADEWYSAGQGLHFGLDVTARCGTPVLSIGDGEVVQADMLSRGSGPHNLVVRHPGQGVTVLYGHLLERPGLRAGQPVARGQPVALSGDPDGSCRSRPHLHLEIRSLDYRMAYNPVVWIEVDWDALMLVGSYAEISFARDLEAPRRWVDPADQPDVRFGGERLNRLAKPWPERRGDAACVINAC